MGYRFEKGESANVGLARMAREQIDAAIEEIRDESMESHETVHQVRKRCKQVRALLRLARPGLGGVYERENTAFRDMARELSHLRDATSVIETYDGLMARFDDQVERRAFAPIRRALTLRRKAIANETEGLAERLDAALEALHAARERVADWPLAETEFEGIRGGLVKTYERGRKAMDAAIADPTPEGFHEWRKRAKYHWYHLRVLSPLWKRVLRAYAGEAHVLSDVLGDEHDLSVLAQTVQAEPERFGAARGLQALLGLLEERREELRGAARAAGMRLYAERPKALAARMAAYWEASRLEHPRARAGEPGDLARGRLRGLRRRDRASR